MQVINFQELNAKDNSLKVSDYLLAVLYIAERPLTINEIFAMTSLDRDLLGTTLLKMAEKQQVNRSCCSGRERTYSLFLGTKAAVRNVAAFVQGKTERVNVIAGSKATDLAIAENGIHFE